MTEINWLAVVAATLAAFAVGSIWYSPMLFLKPWQRETGITTDKTENGNMPLMFGGTLVLMFVTSLVFSMFLGPAPGVSMAMGAGFATGLFLVDTALGVHYLYEQRSLKLWLINGGFNVAVLTTIGLVLGLLT